MSAESVNKIFCYPDSYNILVDHKNNIWDKRYIELAKLVSTWSSCLRRNVGAIIVKDNRILTTGYNGAPTGVVSCKERGECIRNKSDISSGHNYETCYAVHAEQNAIMQAALQGISVQGSTIYCTLQPCSVCARLIINAGIKRVVYVESYEDEFALKLFRDAGIIVDKFEN